MQFYFCIENLSTNFCVFLTYTCNFISVLTKFPQILQVYILHCWLIYCILVAREIEDDRDSDLDFGDEASFDPNDEPDQEVYDKGEDTVEGKDYF